MSFMSSLESTIVPFVHRVQDTIGDVIYSYTGYLPSDKIVDAIFYFMCGFTLYLTWLLVKPAERAYYFRPDHHY